jgi:hypothetical protein
MLSLIPNPLRGQLCLPRLFAPGQFHSALVDHLVVGGGVTVWEPTDAAHETG